MHFVGPGKRKKEKKEHKPRANHWGFFFHVFLTLLLAPRFHESNHRFDRFSISARGRPSKHLLMLIFFLAIVAYIYMPLISPGAGSPPKLGAFIIVIGVGLCALVFTRLLMRSFREWSKMKPYPQVYEDKTRRSGKKEKKTRPFPHH